MAGLGGVGGMFMGHGRVKNIGSCVSTGPSRSQSVHTVL